MAMLRFAKIRDLVENWKYQLSFNLIGRTALFRDVA